MSDTIRTATIRTAAGDLALLSARPMSVTRYSGQVEIHTPAPEGGAFVTYRRCDHEHRTPVGAIRCSRRTARRELELTR